MAVYSERTVLRCGRETNKGYLDGSILDVDRSSWNLILNPGKCDPRDAWQKPRYPVRIRHLGNSWPLRGYYIESAGTKIGHEYKRSFVKCQIGLFRRMVTMEEVSRETDGEEH